MVSAFDITTSINEIEIKKQQRSAKIVFTVSSNLVQPRVNARGTLVLVDPPEGPHVDWLRFETPEDGGCTRFQAPEAIECTFVRKDDGTKDVKRYPVEVKVPVGALGGAYLFQLKMLDAENPSDETVTYGPTVTLRVAAPEPEPPKKKPFPWKLLYQIFTTVVRTATNTLAVPLWSGILFGIYFAIFGEFFDASFVIRFLIGLVFVFLAVFNWAFHTVFGIIVTLLFAVLGLIHGIRMAQAESYFGIKGFLAFLWDHLWSLPNTVLGSIFAAITFKIGIDKSLSAGTGRLILVHGVFPGFDTTIGNVTAGNSVDVHEGVHVLQARIFGLFLYPLWIVNYVINTILPWWLIIQKPRPASFGKYFVCGVYPYTLFELWAYRVQGTRPSCT